MTRLLDLRLLGAVLVLSTALLASGCGSDKSAATTTTTSAADWASGFCSAVTTFKNSLTDTANTLTGNISKAGLQNAVDEAKSATDTFVSTTKDLGKPNTSDGQQAKATLDTLSSQLEADVTSVQSATDSGVLAGISKATGALATAQTQITTAYNQLKGLDAKGELGDAFSQASSCSSLTS
jgi:hypothetical protein